MIVDSTNHISPISTSFLMHKRHMPINIKISPGTFPVRFFILGLSLIFFGQFSQYLNIFLITPYIGLKIGLIRFVFPFSDRLCFFCLGSHINSPFFLFHVPDGLAGCRAIPSFSLCFILFFLRRRLLSISRRLSTFLCLAISSSLLYTDCYPDVKV